MKKLIYNEYEVQVDYSRLANTVSIDRTSVDPRLL